MKFVFDKNLWYVRSSKSKFHNTMYNDPNSWVNECHGVEVYYDEEIKDYIGVYPCENYRFCEGWLRKVED